MNLLILLHHLYILADTHCVKQNMESALPGWTICQLLCIIEQCKGYYGKRPLKFQKWGRKKISACNAYYKIQITKLTVNWPLLFSCHSSSFGHTVSVMRFIAYCMCSSPSLSFLCLKYTHTIQVVVLHLFGTFNAETRLISQVFLYFFNA